MSGQTRPIVPVDTNSPCPSYGTPRRSQWHILDQTRLVCASTRAKLAHVPVEAHLGCRNGIYQAELDRLCL